MFKLLTTIVTQVFKGLVTILTGVSSKLPKLVTHTPQQYAREFSLEVVRPDDLLVVTLDFYNLHIKTSGGSPKVKRSVSGDGFIIAIFPPQSFAEQAFFENAEGALPKLVEDPLTAPPVISRIAGPSQLVFRINDSLLPLDFKLEAILSALSQSESVVQPTIKTPAGRPAKATDQVFFFTDKRSTQFSAIEAPYRLFISPSAASSWQHATAPAKSADGTRTELWHTRLTGDALTASAVWSPDYSPDKKAPPADDKHPFRMSLHAENRHEIVRSTADPTILGAKPVDVERLMLSSQGAWMNVHGVWDNPELALVEWRHLMTAGRDHYVRVVKEGNLFHFGHRAVFIKITERKFQQAKEGPLGAYLRQRYFIVVREPTRTYQHRHLPFRTVTIKNLVTPNLDLPTNHQFLNLAENAFWPRVLGKDFEFHIVATDWEGREIEFLAPLAFIAKSVPEATVFQIVDVYNAEKEDSPLRKRDMGGQKIAYAPFKEPGDTTLETESLVFKAMRAGGALSFLPMMDTARVDVPAVRHISGNPSPSTIALPTSFVNGGGNDIGNMGEVFAQLVVRTKVEFTADKTGGMVAPNFDISGLSRAFGAVGGKIEDFAGGTFNPKLVFPKITLLGGIPLESIVPQFINAAPDVAGVTIPQTGRPRIPQLKSVHTTEPFNGGTRPVIQTSYRWELGTDLAPTDLFQPEDGASFFIETVVNAPLDGSAPNFTVQGGLENFAVTLLPTPEELKLVKLHFTKVGFIAKPGAKVDFSVIFKEFEFVGLLSFVNKLKDVIPMDGFQDPPFLDLVLPPDPNPGVTVGFTQGIPTVGIGIFTLQNISLSASFYLPFIGAPANLRLAFCERHQPFILTVSCFGGGGFFAIDIGFAGVQMIEAALEFGASVALNLGVAKGAACVMAGVYYQRRDDGFAIAAYFRAAGSLSVLGIITVSVELYVSLNYESNKALTHGGKLWGQASLTVKIKIAFFSKSVSISIEREFAGSDPKFTDTVKPDHWIEYCSAFADYPV